MNLICLDARKDLDEVTALCTCLPIALSGVEVACGHKTSMERGMGTQLSRQITKRIEPRRLPTAESGLDLRRWGRRCERVCIAAVAFHLPVGEPARMIVVREKRVRKWEGIIKIFILRGAEPLCDARDGIRGIICEHHDKDKTYIACPGIKWT